MHVKAAWRDSGVSHRHCKRARASRRGGRTSAPTCKVPLPKSGMACRGSPAKATEPAMATRATVVAAQSGGAYWRSAVASSRSAR